MLSWEGVCMPAPHYTSPALGLGTEPGRCVSPALEPGLLRVPPSKGGSRGPGWWGGVGR